MGLGTAGGFSDGCGACEHLRVCVRGRGVMSLLTTPTFSHLLKEPIMSVIPF